MKESQHTTAVAFGITDDETFGQEQMPTMQTPSESGGGHPPAVAFAENQRAEVRISETHPQLTTGGGKAGQGYPAVAVQTDGSDQASTLRGFGHGWQGQHNDTNAVACFSAGQSEGAGTIAYQPEQSPTLRGAASGTNQVPSLHSGMAVRRLTPLECERLMGWHDGHVTDVPGASDSACYRACGNGVAAPVVEWIARRMRREFEEEN